MNCYGIFAYSVIPNSYMGKLLSEDKQKMLCIGSSCNYMLGYKFESAELPKGSIKQVLAV